MKKQRRKKEIKKKEKVRLAGQEGTDGGVGGAHGSPA